MILILLLTLIRPNTAVTPGLTRPLSLHTVCTTAWGRDRRHVTQAMKKQVFATYGVPWARRAEFEVDHLIPRSLAGADNVANLWVQPWAGPHGARDKDRLEVLIGKKVCAGEMTLEFGQQIFVNDWIAAFRLYIPTK